MGSADVSKNLARYGVTAHRHGPNTFVWSVLTAVPLLAIVLSSSVSAQTNVSPSTPRPVNRYLFIIETSRAMQPRAQGVFDAIKHALDSNLNGAIHQGDLVGIWTFNEMVYQELFPTQIWSQPTQLAFAVRLSMFADPKLYQRRSRFDKVVPEMLKALADSENVTIILISTGEGVIEGTRFSEQINSAWKEWHDEQEGVHMPLQTVMRARNGQPTGWFLTAAPRPIDPARLETISKSTEENKRLEVILESGLITNQPASVATEQQVAFSVWDLGKTGLTASATSPQRPSSQLGIGDSAPPAAASANIPNNQRSVINGAASKTAAVPAMHEPNTSAVSAPATAGGQETQISTTSISNAQPADTGKPVELVFVTNAPVQSTPVETAPRESVQPATRAPASVPPSPGTSDKTDPPANHLSLLAHARAADPSQEEKSDLALATPPRGFLRDNIKPLLLMIVGGFGAVYCFKMWLRTNARVKGNAYSLTQTDPDEQVEQEP
jgi:hypothetical protein